MKFLLAFAFLALATGALATFKQETLKDSDDEKVQEEGVKVLKIDHGPQYKYVYPYVHPYLSYYPAAYYKPVTTGHSYSYSSYYYPHSYKYVHYAPPYAAYAPYIAPAQ